MELCGNCDKYRKKEFTTVFECLKYHKCLSGNPPKRCQECVNDKKPKTTNKPDKKEYIEVR